MATNSLTQVGEELDSHMKIIKLGIGQLFLPERQQHGQTTGAAAAAAAGPTISQQLEMAIYDFCNTDADFTSTKRNGEIRNKKTFAQINLFHRVLYFMRKLVRKLILNMVGNQTSVSPELMHQLIQQWDSYLENCNQLDSIFEYLNKCFVRMEMGEIGLGRLAQNIWNEIMFPTIPGQICNFVIDTSHSTDESIHGVSGRLMNALRKQGKYEDNYFFEKLKLYYQQPRFQTSLEQMIKMGVETYKNNIDNVIIRVTTMVCRYLDSTALEPALNIVHNGLIEGDIENLKIFCDSLLDNGRITDLSELLRFTVSRPDSSQKLECPIWNPDVTQMERSTHKAT